MSQLILHYRNILETGIVTSTDENTSFPLYRTYDRDIGKLFKFLTHGANLYVAVDQGAVISYEVDRLIIPLGHTLNGLDMKLQYSTTPFPIASVTIGAGGTSYQVNDVLTLVQAGAAGGTVTVDTVDAGVITAVSLTTAGTNYRVANGLATTGHTGDATINVVTVGATDALSWTQGDVLVINKSFAAQTKQYWRLLITEDPAAPPEIPEIYLTKDYTFVQNPSYGARGGYQLNVLREETFSGRVRRVKFGSSRRVRNYNLPYFTTTDKAAFEAWEAVWDGIKYFYITDVDGTLIYMELLNDLLFIDDAPNTWSCELQLFEVL